ncbi:hypothetical protein O6P43_018206 [Quillaja saponaria]|uniref:Uncharacterized protein n=1 Tax=Quillaja saponaria TaxID=32244 RepID=A0AAD7LRM8_QUISA|nr:hypothetical protein O6P43_018206 [Quillaja saponaria]
MSCIIGYRDMDTYSSGQYTFIWGCGDTLLAYSGLRGYGHLFFRPVIPSFGGVTHLIWDTLIYLALVESKQFKVAKSMNQSSFH